MSNRAKIFIALITVGGTAVLAQALAHWQSLQLAGSTVLLVVSVLASRLRVKLPGLTGTMSVNLPFILVAIAVLSASESMVVGCASTLTQSLPAAGRKLNKVQAIFNVCNMALAIAATRMMYASPTLSGYVSSPSLRLILTTAGFFLANSVPVAIIISLTENSHPAHTWAEMFQLSYPYYVASGGIAGAVISMSRDLGWWQPATMLLIVLGILHSYRRYFSRSAASAAARVVSQAG